MRLDPELVLRAVARALDEDLGDRGDITSNLVVPEERRSAGRILARESLVLAGLALARGVFQTLDPRLEFETLAQDGDTLDCDASVAVVRGSTRAILAGERTALNFLMRMSGIATAARHAVEEIEGSGARILDTRKTAPGLRHLDKYAVSAGGATNHRLGLYDEAMIKDTHLDSGSTISDAVQRLLEADVPAAKITVEVRSLEQLREALAAGAGRALLDNMDLPTLRAAVEQAGGRIVLEASGGLRPGKLREVACTGVDFLSLGWLTHSVRSADLSMTMESER